jgi:hypothetical protein
MGVVAKVLMMAALTALGVSWLYAMWVIYQLHCMFG